MVEIESMATQGGISRPGAWSFPDCLELGVAGEGTFTWIEAQTVLALFAVTSSPLILGYVRTCHVCERGGERVCVHACARARVRLRVCVVICVCAVRTCTANACTVMQ